jgi:phosphonopyruvate decarboxylase
MIRNDLFYNALRSNDVGFFCGVPDSLLKEFCGYLSNSVEGKSHIISANEGGAVALASGYHLATGKLPFVYMQNSGLGNAINPLLSLADQEVYSIPMLVLIGWRGEPGIDDEPQHRKQGRVQNSMLDAMEIPYFIMDADTPDVSGFVSKAANKAKETRGAVAIVVRKNSFEAYEQKTGKRLNYNLTREEAIACVLDKLSSDDIIVSTTGKASREVYECRAYRNQEHTNDFLTVGSMGHSSQIALGIALHSDQNVFCLDGDGSVIMHMGSLAINGNEAPRNFRHIVLNNGAHDSVGGQPTVGFDISIPSIANACGYQNVYAVSSKVELETQLPLFITSSGPALLEIKVDTGARGDLGRPESSPVENKIELMKSLNSNS